MKDAGWLKELKTMMEQDVQVQNDVVITVDVSTGCDSTDG